MISQDGCPPWFKLLSTSAGYQTVSIPFRRPVAAVQGFPWTSAGRSFILFLWPALVSGGDGLAFGERRERARCSHL